IVREPAASLPARPPVLCAGCGHRGLFYVLKKLKLTVTGDIGCYTLSALPPLSAMDTCICMGASIGTAIGMEKALGAEHSKKTVAVIGDSTFVHSGITGLVDAVYNRSNVTVIILDNRTTAMTGHQDHPGTGKTLSGDPTVELDFEKLAQAVGVKHIQVVDPYDLKETERVVREEAEREAPSVIIARHACVLLTRERHSALRIDPELCVQCGICLRLGCPAISKEGDQVRITPELCTGCGMCAEVCPKEAIVGA
ncbi:MAG: 4Fe-4S binding protein, partial [Candidatus Latescibacteria bacterium]|nr:4Fe-4S binding protein [Candidatus Latescibacterota bacterium]